ncbi:hypothetical protein D3C75_1210490 [compost metagenome]
MGGPSASPAAIACSKDTAHSGASPMQMNCSIMDSSSRNCSTSWAYWASKTNALGAASCRMYRISRGARRKLTVAAMKPAHSQER